MSPRSEPKLPSTSTSQAQYWQALCKAGAPKVETRYEIESPDDPTKVAAMLRNAKNGCWVRAAVANPTPFEDTLTLNGKSFVLD